MGWRNCNAVTVGNAQQGEFGPKVSGPMLLICNRRVRSGNLGKPVSIVVAQSGIASALADALDGVENAERIETTSLLDGIA